MAIISCLIRINAKFKDAIGARHRKISRAGKNALVVHAQTMPNNQVTKARYICHGNLCEVTMFVVCKFAVLQLLEGGTEMPVSEGTR